MRVVMFLAVFAVAFMITFFDRCLIARVLKLMPWNHGNEA